MFEIEMEVLMGDAFTEKQVRDGIIATLKAQFHLTHVRTELSEKKVKDWIIDRDLYWDSPENISIELGNLNK